MKATTRTRALAALLACTAGGHVLHLHRRHAATKRELAATAQQLGTATRQLAAAECDAVTGLLTRGPWLREASAAYRSDSNTTVVFIDLDRFKGVNDQLGHDAGDQVLRAAAAALATVLGADDGAAVVGRIGGDEYAAVVAGIRSGAAGEAQLAHVHAVLADALADACTHPELGASLGAVRIAAADRPLLDHAVGAADRLMYAAKRAGADVSVLAATA